MLFNYDSECDEKETKEEAFFTQSIRANYKLSTFQHGKSIYGENT